MHSRCGAVEPCVDDGNDDVRLWSGRQTRPSPPPGCVACRASCTRFGQVGVMHMTTQLSEDSTPYPASMHHALSCRPAKSTVSCTDRVASCHCDARPHATDRPSTRLGEPSTVPGRVEGGDQPVLVSSSVLFYFLVFLCFSVVGGLGFEFCLFVAGWKHALRSEWPFIIIII